MTLEDTLVYQAEVCWAFADGRRITTPYVNVVRFAGNLVADYRVHVDLSVLREGASGAH